MTTHEKPRITWLGQSGFIIESSTGESYLLDPYLSDWAFDDIRTPRAITSPVDVDALSVTGVVATHWHHDHLDLPTCEKIGQRLPDAVFIGPSSITPRLLGRGVATERVLPLERGETVSRGAFTFHGTYARHEVPGWLTEDALGLVIEVDGVRVFVSGDTEYDSRILDVRALGPFDLGLFVINGSGGNMNALEAGLLAYQIAPARAIPMHYGMWPPAYYGPDATLDPDLFADVCRRLGGPETYTMQLGERIEISAA
jgi:L-ascorbate 6-phosphate lactonase